jgi:hypothetical protein
LSKTFRACKSEFIKYSGYFKIALSGRWESNNDGHIEIEDEPWLFEVFSRLAHTAQVFSWVPNKDVEWSVEPGHWPVKLLSEEDETSRLDADMARMDDFMSLPFFSDEAFTPSEANCLPELYFADILDLYTFANRRDIPRLANMAVSLMQDKTRTEELVPISAINTIFENTAAAQDSPMFRMLIELAAHLVSDTEVDQHMDDLPKELLIAVLRKQKTLAAESAKELAKEDDAIEKGRTFKSKAHRSKWEAARKRTY